MLSDLSMFVVSVCKITITKFVNERDCFYSHKVFYLDTVGICFHMDQYQKLKEAEDVGKFQKKENEYGDAGVFFGKMNYVLY